MQNVVIINGYGHLGSTIAKKLKDGKNYEPVIIEQDDEKVAMALQDGYDVIHADGSSAKIIKELYQKRQYRCDADTQKLRYRQYLLHSQCQRVSRKNLLSIHV